MGWYGLICVIESLFGMEYEEGVSLEVGRLVERLFYDLEEKCWCELEVKRIDRSLEERFRKDNL